MSKGNIFVLIRHLEDECLLGIQHLNIDKIDLYAKDPHEANYQSLINKRKVVDLKDCNDSKTSIECSNDMDNIYEKIEKHNSNKKRKILIVFDDIIADMLSNRKLQQK